MSPAQRSDRVYYSQWLPKGAGLFSETRTLLQAWQPGESAPNLARRVVEQDLLGKTTARRGRDIVLMVFGPRFLSPDDAAARHLKRIADGKGARQLFSDLAFYYSAQRDLLLRDFTILSYWPAVRSGQLVISNQQVLDFIWEAEQDGRIRTRWSDTIKPRLAGCLLAALTDFGLVRQYKPSRREVVLYSPADGTLVYMAYLLHESGVTDSALARHPAWSLFGLQPTDVLNRLDALSSQGWFIVQRAGDVVRISWPHESIEEVVDALSR